MDNFELIFSATTEIQRAEDSQGMKNLKRTNRKAEALPVMPERHWKNG
jgi:hypothetical protein